jgi:hypothetical protein
VTAIAHAHPSDPVAAARKERAAVRRLAAAVDAARLALGRRLGGPAAELDARVDRLLGDLWRLRFRGRLAPDRVLDALSEAGVEASRGALAPVVELLGREPDPALGARLARAHELVLTRRLARRGRQVRLEAAETRRRRGVYYTPADVVAYIVEETLGAVLRPWEAELPQASPARLRELLDAARGLAVFDPACGAGAFLLGALERLRAFYAALGAALGTEAPTELAAPGRLALRANLFGLDLDGRALALAELALQAQVAREPGRTVALVGKRLRLGDHLAFDHGRAFRAAFRRDDPGFDVVLGNPPYAPLAPAQVEAAQAAGYAAHDAHDLYALFVEGLTRLTRASGRGGLIVPLSLVFSRSVRTVRERVILASSRGWRLASFDRIPSGLFEASVRTRTTIALVGPVQGQATVCATPLVRFTAAQRPQVFARLRFVDVTDLHHARLGFPKPGSPLQGAWLRRWADAGARLADGFVSRGEHRLHFKTNCYAFAIVTAELPPAWGPDGRPVPQTKYASLAFASRDDRDVALALLAGAWGLWWWLVHGDGFDVTATLLGALPVDPRSFPGAVRAQLARLGRRIQAAVREHVATKRNGGKLIGTFDLRRCRSLTDRADELVAEALGAEDLLADVRAFLGQTHGVG